MPGLSRQAKVFIVITAVLASLLEIIDTSIVAVAVPRMQGNLGVTYEEITWVSTGYIIANAVILPIASWLGVRIGRRTYFTGCIVLFTFTSLLCGMAPSFGFLVAARVVQGAAGGALLPTSQTLIQEQFPGEKSGLGSAIYGMSVMIGPALGPTLGGYLTDRYSWRSIFYINLPVGALAAALSYAFIRQEPEEGRSRVRGRIDWLGFALLVAGIGCLQFVLERGQQDDWFHSSMILAATTLAGLAIPSFFVWEYRNSHPIVDVKLFRESAIRSGTALMAAMGMVLYALVFLLPEYTDLQLGMDATHTGYLYIPGSIATMLLMPVIGHYLGKVGPKPFIFAGACLIGVCLWQFSRFTAASGADNIVWALVFRGLGLGCLFVPINAAVLSQFEGEKLGQAAGLLNLSRQIGGSVGIAGMTTFLDRFGAQLRNDLRPYVSAANPSAVGAFDRASRQMRMTFHDLRGMPPLSSVASPGLAETAAASLKSLQDRMERQVFQLSFNRLMVLVLVVFAISMFPLFTMKLKRKPVGAVGGH